MVTVRAKRALWGANASLLQSLAVGDNICTVLYCGPIMLEVTLDFRGSANETPAKSAQN